MAESKLDQVNQQIENLMEMRNRLEAMLEHWDVKLARTRRGQLARLLEDLPQEGRGKGLRRPFTKKTRKEVRV